MKLVAFSLVTSAGITGTASVSFEASIDGTNYVPLVVVTDITNGADVTSVTLTSSMKSGYTLMCAGFKYVQANVATGGSAGTITIFGRAVA